MTGANGTPEGVTMLDGRDATEDPSVIYAVTVNTYDVPFTRPVTVVVVDEILVTPPSPDTTVPVVVLVWTE
jgi:hypothetical protein